MAEGNYLTGENFTAADLYPGSRIGFAMQFGALERRRALEKYRERTSNRLAAVRVGKIDEALIAKKKLKRSVLAPAGAYP